MERVGSHVIAHLPVDDFSIMLLWSRKLDSSMIATTLGVPEHVIANRLAQIRDRQHGGA